MIGQFVVEVILEAVVWLVFEVLVKGLRWLAAAVYRAVRVPFALLAGVVLAGGEREASGEDRETG